MEKLPSEKNALASLFNEVIKIMVQLGQKAAKTYLVAQVPFFGLPVISQLTDGILSFINGYIYRGLATGSTFLIIDAQVYFQKEAYSKAQADLIKVYEKEGTETENAKKAREKARQELGDLIRWDGAARP